MTRILSLIFAGLCTTSTLAGGLERAWVDPDATWAAHVDFEGLFGSQAFRQLSQAAGIDLAELEAEARLDADDIELEGQDIPPEVAEAWRNMDISLLDDLKSLTVFGTGVREEPELVILRTTDAIDELVASLEPLEGVQIAQDENMSFVALGEAGAQTVGAEQVAAIRRNPFTHDRTVVVAESTAKLIDALELYARQSAAGPNGGPAWAQPRDGSFLFVHLSGDGLGMLDDEASQILGQATEVHLEAGEAAGEVYVDALVGAEDAQTANNLVAAANGILAIGRMGLAQEPEGQALIGLINAFRITSQGTAMAVEFRMEIGALAETLQRLQELEEHGERIESEEDGEEIEIRIKAEF